MGKAQAGTACSSGCPSARCRLKEALELAARGRQIDGDSRWALPLAMAHWLEGRYSDALACLLEPSVVQASDSLWLYHNLVGMVARKLDGETDRALGLSNAPLSSIPTGQTPFTTLPISSRTMTPRERSALYRRSLVLEPSAPSAWHNYGTALNSLTQYQEALVALRLSLRLDPLVADVWCNLGLAYFGLEDFCSAERAFRHAIALDASHAASHTNLGNALISVLQPEEALLHLGAWCGVGSELHSLSLESCARLLASW